ncbi:Oxygen sensor histidine kinase NreB [compost metagenome]
MEVRIEDQGKGFIRKRDAKGVGLFSMEERAKSIGGLLDICSEQGTGTTVTLKVPIKS